MRVEQPFRQRDLGLAIGAALLVLGWRHRPDARVRQPRPGLQRFM